MKKFLLVFLHKREILNQIFDKTKLRARLSQKLSIIAVQIGIYCFIQSCPFQDLVLSPYSYYVLFYQYFKFISLIKKQKYLEEKYKKYYITLFHYFFLKRPFQYYSRILYGSRVNNPLYLIIQQQKILYGSTVNNPLYSDYNL